MTAFLAKPYDGDELLRAVRGTLDAAKCDASGRELLVGQPPQHVDP